MLLHTEMDCIYDHDIGIVWRVFEVFSFFHTVTIIPPYICNVLAGFVSWVRAR